MKTLIATAALAIASTAAQADELVKRTLHQSGYWQTVFEYNTGTADLFCVAKNENRAEGVFEIVVDEWDNYALMLFAYDVRAPLSGIADLDVVIDGGRHPDITWTLYDAQVDQMGRNATVIFHMGKGTQLEAQEFIEDVMLHLNLTLLDSRGRSLAFWSLRGSAAAIRALEDCRRSIQIR